MIVNNKSGWDEGIVVAEKKKCPVCGSEEYEEYEEYGVVDGDDNNEFKTPEYFWIKNCGNGCDVEGSASEKV